MTIYADSSALVKLYVAEENSDVVASLAQRSEVAFAFNGLHDLEVRNALRLLAYRGIIPVDTLLQSLAALDSDVESDLYTPQSLEFAKVTSAAQRLSAATALTAGARALDLLHVAAAQLGGFDGFASFDRRQVEVARRAGLTILELGSSPPA